MNVFEAIGRKIARRAVVDACEKYFASDQFRSVVHNAIRSDPRFPWLAAMAREFMRVDATMTPRAAWNMALETTAEYLKDEGIKFGANDYAWDEGGARDIADEYQIRHWEPRS